MKTARAAALAREELDRRLKRWRRGDRAPPKGWIHEVREALGMSTRVLARRLGISQSSASGLEKSEATGSIRLATLQKAAKAMNCRLYYAIAPREGNFADVVRRRAFAVATFPSMVSIRRGGFKMSQSLLRAFIEHQARTVGPDALWDDEVLGRQIEEVKREGEEARRLARLNEAAPPATQGPTAESPDAAAEKAKMDALVDKCIADILRQARERGELADEKTPDNPGDDVYEGERLRELMERIQKGGGVG